MEERASAQGGRRGVRIASVRGAYYDRATPLIRRAQARQKLELYNLAQSFGLTKISTRKNNSYTIGGFQFGETPKGKGHGWLGIPEPLRLEAAHQQYHGAITHDQYNLMLKMSYRVQGKWMPKASLAHAYEAEFERIKIEDILSVPISEIRTMPVTPVIYFLYGKGGELLYIGQSHNAQVRWRMHTKYRNEVERIGWADVEDWRDLTHAETFFIQKMQPRDNVVHNPKNKQRATA